MPSDRHRALQPLVDDLRRTFGERLEAIVAYGSWQHGPVPSLALVRSMTMEDLEACAARTRAWHRAGAATPLLLTPTGFARSLDAFPIEYGEILSSHDVVFGRDPFEGLSIRGEDLRRACEVQVKSHLVHLREDYLESGGRPAAVDALIRESVPGFVAILRHLARLDEVPAEAPADFVSYATRRIRLDPHTVSDLVSLADPDGLPAVDAVKLFPAYLSAMEHLAEFVDRWSGGREV